MNVTMTPAEKDIGAFALAIALKRRDLKKWLALGGSRLDFYKMRADFGYD